MKSHSSRVAFLRLHVLNTPLDVQRQINREDWRYTWYGESKEAIDRPTEAEAIARIFLTERGIHGYSD